MFLVPHSHQFGPIHNSRYLTPQTNWDDLGMVERFSDETRHEIVRKMIVDGNVEKIADASWCLGDHHQECLERVH